MKQKRNKAGQAGIPSVDPVLDKELFAVITQDENGKAVRLGKFRLAHELDNALGRVANELKVPKAKLIRTVLTSFVQYHDDAKQIGGERFYEIQKTIEQWIQERSEFAPLLTSLISKDHLMDLESKSPECKLLSQQLVLIGKMLNLTNKNVI
tara:strand:+ start:360 stop:815 length:456 start_codon:yes stop_codon:yes gene_type:complete